MPGSVAEPKNFAMINLAITLAGLVSCWLAESAVSGEAGPPRSLGLPSRRVVHAPCAQKQGKQQQDSR